MTLQAFKGTDAIEARVTEAFLNSLNVLGLDHDAFYTGSYQCFVLGDVLFTLKASPLANSLTQDIFRKSFPAIHQLFTRPGTFEFYIEVFKAVWGEGVDIEFVVPAAGKLTINIEALTSQTDDALARRIEDNVYLYDEIMDHEGNNLAFQGSSGIKTQEEAESLIKELYPDGLWVDINLVLS